MENPAQSSHDIVVCALYHFARLDDYEILREPLQAFCDEHNIKGALLLAREGINGTVAGSPSDIDDVLAHLKSDPRLSGLEHKLSYASSMPFYRMKVKLKKEIVTLGVDGVDPNDIVGTYVSPQDWNAIISDPDVLVLDTRNDYEYQIGTFKGAINPKTSTFRQFPKFIAYHYDPKQHKKVAMFCTGGIRCEKASSLMMQQGFEEVYHLKGGILKYLEEVPEQESLWQGECFVFDDRVAVKHGLEIGQYSLCRGCRWPLAEKDKQSAHYQEGICCARCFDVLSPEKRHGLEERQKQTTLAKKRGEQHLGMSLPDARKRKLEQRRALGAKVPKYLESKQKKHQ